MKRNKLRKYITQAMTAVLIGLLLFGLQGWAAAQGADSGEVTRTLEEEIAAMQGEEAPADTDTQAEEASAAPLAGHSARLVDEADLLSTAEEASLTAKLEEISARQQFDIVVLTVPSLLGKEPNAYADDFYDEGGYGFGADRDGCLLLLSMEERDWAISTTGYGIDALTDYGQEALMDEVLPFLSRGDYGGAFTLFAEGVDHLVTEAKNGTPVDIYEEEKPRGGMPSLGWLFGDLGIGAILSAGPMNAEKKKLRTVRNRYHADGYANWRGGRPAQGAATGIYLNQYLNTTTSTRVIPVVTHNNHNQNRPGSGGGHGSTIHMGGSGTFHGGSHGKF